jgi:hypothetical protein
VSNVLRISSKSESSLHRSETKLSNCKLERGTSSEFEMSILISNEYGTLEKE